MYPQPKKKSLLQVALGVRRAFGASAQMRRSDLRLQKVCAALLLIAYFPAAMVNADNRIEVLPAHTAPTFFNAELARLYHFAFEREHRLAL